MTKAIKKMDRRDGQRRIGGAVCGEGDGDAAVRVLVPGSGLPVAAADGVVAGAHGIAAGHASREFFFFSRKMRP